MGDPRVKISFSGFGNSGFMILPEVALAIGRCCCCLVVVLDGVVVVVVVFA